MSVFKLSKETKFKGPRKIGFDTDYVVNAIDNIALHGDPLSGLSRHGNVLHLHEKNLDEIPHILVTKKNWQAKKAKQALNKFIRDFNIKVVSSNRSNPHLGVLKWKCKKNKVDIHPPDSWIVADYKAEGINRVISCTGHVVEASRLLGMDATQPPSLDDVMVKKKLREVFRRPKSHRK